MASFQMNTEVKELIDSFNLNNPKLELMKDEDEIDIMLASMYCNICKTHTIETIDGYLTCTNCGRVKFDKIIDHSYEWRYYHHEDSRGADPSRCGMPTSTLVPNSSLSTVIGGKNSYITRLQGYLSTDHKERDLIKVCSDIENKCLRYGTSKAIINKAQFYFKDIKDLMDEFDDIKRSNNRDGLIGACLYNAYKNFGCPKRTRDIALIMGINEKYITNGIKIFGEIFDKKKITIKTRSSNAMDFVASFCSKLDLNERLTDLVRKIVKKMIKYKVAMDHASESQTAGALWYVIKKCGYEKSRPKSIIAERVNVSEVTISRAYDKIRMVDEGKKGNKTACGTFTKSITKYIEDERAYNTEMQEFEDVLNKPKRKRGRKPKPKPIPESEHESN